MCIVWFEWVKSYNNCVLKSHLWSVYFKHQLYLVKSRYGVFGSICFKRDNFDFASFLLLSIPLNEISIERCSIVPNVDQRILSHNKVHLVTCIQGQLEMHCTWKKVSRVITLTLFYCNYDKLSELLYHNQKWSWTMEIHVIVWSTSQCLI